VLFVSVLFPASSFASDAVPAHTIQVGVALRFAPDLNSFAGSIYQGIEYAKEIFEASHPDYAIELIKYPHKNEHGSVDDAAKKIIEDKVKFVIGGEMSDDAFALAENFHDHNVLLMTPTASNPLLTAGNPLVFRACYSDDQVATQMARYVSSLDQVHSIGVIHNTSNAYSDYLTNAFLDEYAKAQSHQRSGTRITEFRYGGDQPDFKNTVEQFKKASVDLVVAFTLQEHLKSFYLLASRIGLKPSYLGSDGWGTTESIQKWIGPDFRGFRNAYWAEDSKDPKVSTFKNGFEKKNGKSPDAWNAISYDAAFTLFEAFTRAKDPQPSAAQIAEILRSGVFKNGVTARTLQFNHQNTILKPLYVYEIQKSGTKLLKEIK